MDFREATGRLGAPVTQQQIAEECGVSISAIRQARLDDGHDGYRTPPPGWEKCLASLARKRAGELVKLADELEGEG